MFFYFSITRDIIIRKVSSKRFSIYMYIIEFFILMFCDLGSNYWGPEFNYEYYDDRLKIKPACQYVSEVVSYWLSEFHFDAIRFDSGTRN